MSLVIYQVCTNYPQIPYCKSSTSKNFQQKGRTSYSKNFVVFIPTYNQDRQQGLATQKNQSILSNNTIWRENLKS